MSKYEEPLVHQLIQVTKKYLSAFSECTGNIPLERYHYVLLLIDEHGELLTQKDLAQLIQVDKSFVVSMVNHLTENGLAYRETNDDDRRKHVIRLTEKAKSMIPEINESIVHLNRKAFQNISPEKVKAFYEIIDVLQSNLKQIVNTHEIVLDYNKLKSS